MLLQHGCGSLGEEILRAFAGMPPPFRLYTVDRPGYGFSDPLSPESEGADGQTGGIGRVLDALGIARATVVAHALGSAPARLFAAEPPERVAGLLLIAHRSLGQSLRRESGLWAAMAPDMSLRTMYSGFSGDAATT